MQIQAKSSRFLQRNPGKDYGHIGEPRFIRPIGSTYSTRVDQDLVLRYDNVQISCLITWTLVI